MTIVVGGQFMKLIFTDSWNFLTSLRLMKEVWAQKIWKLMTSCLSKLGVGFLWSYITLWPASLREGGERREIVNSQITKKGRVLGGWVTLRYQIRTLSLLECVYHFHSFMISIPKSPLMNQILRGRRNNRRWAEKRWERDLFESLCRRARDER